MQREYEGESVGSIEEATLNSFATVLYEMNKLDLANKFFRRQNRELPLDDTFNRARCYHNIGVVAFKQKHFDESLKWLEKALNMFKSSPNPKIAATYLCIGNVYQGKKHFDRALEFYRPALEVSLKDYGEQHYIVAHCYQNMANVYYVQKHFEEARELYMKALRIEQNRVSPNLAFIYNNLGNLLDDIDETKEAIEYYEKALDIRKNLLPSDHPLIASTYKNLGIIYSKIGNLTEADICYEKEQTIMGDRVTHKINYKCPRCHQRVYVTSTFAFLQGRTCLKCRRKRYCFIF
jgi:tetratricopeptide (TPR) repeat protein